MAESDPMHCPRCATSLQYIGTKKFHEGTGWSVFGELGELFENREHFDVYMCPAADVSSKARRWNRPALGR